MNKVCKNCGQNYEVDQTDQSFYEKMTPIVNGKKLPLIEQHLCPLCREQRRMAIRNERSLYRRKSDLSGETIISSISPDKPYKVFSREEWWSDQWDAMEYGRDFDFNRPFFEQFHELMVDVPHMSLNTWQSDNCDYCNYIDFSRNCYLVFGGSNCEDCYYSTLVDSCRDCIDTTGLKECELGYDSVDCEKCNNFICSIRCENSHDLKFCFDCKSCSDCLGCYNLRHKQYCIFNRQYSKEEYFAELAKYDFSDRGAYQKLKKQFLDFIKHKAVHRYAQVIGCDNCSGDNLSNSKNTSFSFESNNLEDCKYMQFSMNSRDVYDVMGTSARGGEVCMEAISIEGKRILAGHYIAGHSDVYYSDSVFACRDIFGCVGIKNKQYCIFNKQYSKEEYEKLFERIVEHMVKNGEWGEFFPVTYSKFAYNETVAQEHFPLSKDEVLQKGYQWKDLEEKSDFKMIPQELKLYEKLGVPKPDLSPNERHRERLALRNPHNLWERTCGKCGALMKSAFTPDRPELVYCEKCYRELD